MASEIDKSTCRNFKREHTIQEVYDGIEDGFILGFKTSKNFIENKVVTIKQIIQILENEKFGQGSVSRDEYKFRVISKLQSLLPKTEWNIEINKKGEIKLI